MGIDSLRIQVVLFHTLNIVTSCFCFYLEARKLGTTSSKTLTSQIEPQLRKKNQYLWDKSR